MSVFTSDGGVQQLGGRLRGHVSGGDGLRSVVASATFNPAVRRRPDVVVEPVDADDVVAALDWAVEHHRPWAVLGTGHAETPVADGSVLVTTRQLSSVAVDPVTRTARVGAGTTWRRVMQAADPHGLSAVCGSAPDVGVVGLLLGGGIGPLARTLGVCSDYVTAVHLVMPGTGPLTVDADRRPDLFGALLGGRPDIGVVTGVDVRLVAQNELTAGGLFFAEHDIPAVVAAWSAWTTQGVAQHITTSLAVLRLPEVPTLPPVLAGATVAHLRIAATGPAAGRELLPPAVQSAGTALLGGVGPLPWARIGEIHGDPVVPVVHVGGGLLLHAFAADTAAALLTAAGPQVSTPLGIAEIRHLGGAMTDAPRDRPDCVPGRNAAFGTWVSSAPFPLPGPDNAPVAAGATAAVRAVLDTLAPWSPHAAAINFSGSANTRTEITRGWSPAARAHLAQVGARHPHTTEH